MAENLLMMLRPDRHFTALEAQVLDLALVLHMEHGGGNNSAFTTHVVTSAGSDTYSVMAAALCSLKGPQHGGANLKVVGMMDDLRAQVADTTDREQVERYLTRVLHGEEFDHSGLIYGMGHAVYSLSDPRAVIFKSFVQRLAQEKGRQEEYALYASWHRKSSAGSGKSTRASVPMWTFTAALSIGCWISPRNCLRRFLRWREWWAGVPTEWKNLSTPIKLSARHI